MSYEFIMPYRCIYSMPCPTSPVCNTTAISGHSMRIDLWFDRRACTRGGSTVEVCASILLCTFVPRLP